MAQILRVSSHFLNDLTHISQNWQSIVHRDFVATWSTESGEGMYLSAGIQAVSWLDQRGRVKYCFPTCHKFSLKTLAAGGAGCMSISWSVIQLPLVIFILPVPMPPSAKNMASCCNHWWCSGQSSNLWICAVQSWHTRRCSLIVI